MGIIYIPSFYMRHTCCRFIEPNWSICAITAIRFEIFLRNERSMLGNFCFRREVAFSPSKIKNALQFYTLRIGKSGILIYKMDR